MDLSMSGLASGMDWKTTVEQLAQVERAPQTQMRTAQNKLQQINNAYGSIKTQLSVLQNRLNTLQDGSLFDSRSTSVGDSSIATATAAAATPLGSYTFNFTQLATSSTLRGAGNIGARLSGTTDVSGVVLSSAGFSSAATAGTFTVNGKQVTVATSDTLQSVFDKISTATGGDVTASYDPTTDKIKLTGVSAIVLGSAADTSNFLQIAKLNNNGTATTSSSSSLGSVKPTVNLSSSNLTTAVTNGASGSGSFEVNGVSISFDATKDSLQNVLDRISTSAAGVTASYDVINDRVVLTNKTTGDVGVSLSDVSGNFLQATGLLGGTLDRGKDLIYTINGGDPITSRSNTITSETSGITGLSVTALSKSSTTVTVSADTAKIQTAISSFVTEYSKLQSMIGAQTASTTDSTGKVTAGTLSNETEADSLARQLRGIVSKALDSSASTFRRLEAIGITANGNDDTLTISDSEALSSALTTNLAGVKNLFTYTNDTHTNEGLAVQLDNFIDGAIGDNGWLSKHQSNLSKQITDFDTQIADQERYVQTVKARLTAGFIAMETAQQKANEQLTYLSKTFS